MKKLLLPLIISTLLVMPIVSGMLFESKTIYSYINQKPSLGEQRNIIQLVFSTNRLELKDKIDTTIYSSYIRNRTLKLMADTTWFLQNKSKIIDFQVFDTEVFFGKYGELYPV